MLFIVHNDITKVVVGGKDHLLKTDIFKELHKYLSVEVKDAEHIIRAARKKNRFFKWDGYHRFMNKQGVFATGLLPVALDFLKEFPVEVKIQDERQNLPNFIKGEWNISTPDFDLYDHQVDLISSVNNYIDVAGSPMYFPRGMWKAATNSGKTAAFGVLVKNIQNPKALLLVDSQELFEQHMEFYGRMFKDIGLVGRVGKKYVSQFKPHFTLAMVDTLANRMKEMSVLAILKNHFNILGVDESHGFATENGVKVISATNAGMKIFMSGTPVDMGDAITKYKLLAMSGMILHVINKRWLMDNGFSMIPQIYLHENPTPSPPNKILWPKEYEEIVMLSPERADMIADIIAERPDKKIMITFNEEKHGSFMYERLRDRYDIDKVSWVHGSDNRRSEKLADFISGDIRVLFSSTIFRQGLNVKDIGVIINGIAGKGIITLSQFMGRGERLDGINKHFEWHDFFDHGQYVSRHSLQRIKFYLKEELDINFLYEHTRHGRPRA